MTNPVDKNVQHPSHYNTGKIEVIDFIVDQKMGFCDGNVVKYVSRFRHKGRPLEDLKKAKFYLEALIKLEEEQLKQNPVVPTEKVARREILGVTETV